MTSVPDDRTLTDDYQLAAVDNAHRVKEGVRAALAGKIAEFAKKNADLIVVFDDPFSKFGGGRISLFQQFVADRIGVIPEYLKSVPACVKVFFSLSPYSEENIVLLKSELRSLAAYETYQNLRISQVQLRGEIVFHADAQMAKRLGTAPAPLSTRP